MLLTPLQDKKEQHTLTTLEKDELASQGSGRRSATARALKRRSTEQAVNKIIKGNFHTLSPAMTDGKLNAQGNTLREQLKADRKTRRSRWG